MLALMGTYDFAKNVNYPLVLQGVAESLILSLFRAKAEKLEQFFLDDNDEEETIEDYENIEKNYTKILKKIRIFQNSIIINKKIKFCTQNLITGAKVSDHSYRVPNNIKFNIFIDEGIEDDVKTYKELEQLFIERKKIIFYTNNSLYTNIYVDSLNKTSKGLKCYQIEVFLKEVIEAKTSTETFKKTDIVSPKDANTENIKNTKTSDDNSVDGLNALNKIRNCYAIMPLAFQGVFA